MEKKIILFFLGFACSSRVPPAVARSRNLPSACTQALISGIRPPLILLQARDEPKPGRKALLAAWLCQHTPSACWHAMGRGEASCLGVCYCWFSHSSGQGVLGAPLCTHGCWVAVSIWCPWTGGSAGNVSELQGGGSGSSTFAIVLQFEACNGFQI